MTYEHLKDFTLTEKRAIFSKARRLPDGDSIVFFRGPT